MTIHITPIVAVMPFEYFAEFERVLEASKYNTTFDDGSMLVFTGACVRAWSAAANVRRSWLDELTNSGVYALGIDAFSAD